MTVVTVVSVKLSRPVVGGLGAVVEGLRWEPTRRRVEGDVVVLPDGFFVDLVGGEALVGVAPTGPGWCWRVTELSRRGVTRFVSVPDAPLVSYTDLVDVDPATLDPAAVPDPAWWAALRGAELGVHAVVDPDDSGALILSFQSWQKDPADDFVLFMPIQEA